MGLISRVSSRTYRSVETTMKVKGDLKEYRIIGRKLPTTMEPHPKLFRQQIFAPDTVAAKSRFWKFLSYYQKINKKVDDSALSDPTPSFKQFSANGCPRHFNFCNTREYVWFMNVLLNLFLLFDLIL